MELVCRFPFFTSFSILLILFFIVCINYRYYLIMNSIVISKKIDFINFLKFYCKYVVCRVLSTLLKMDFIYKWIK